VKYVSSHILRGQIDTGTYNGSENRIQLFDGQFDTGFKVVEFKISPVQPLSNHDLVSVLSTHENSALGEYDFSNQEQVAWAQYGIWHDTGLFAVRDDIIDEDNMIVMDLWINSYTTGDATQMNYYIKLDKYNFSSWEGALSIVRNQSQG